MVQKRCSTRVSVVEHLHINFWSNRPFIHVRERQHLQEPLEDDTRVEVDQE